MRKVEERMEDEDEHVRDSAFYALEAVFESKRLFQGFFKAFSTRFSALQSS